jgi:addiction module RelE/StbE family toxin
MEQIKWTTKSLKDLKVINDFISLDSKFYAARFINRLIQRVDQLVLFPDSGRIVPEKNNPEIRELIEGNYRIFYRKHKNVITILRIHNSARRIK